MNRHDHELVPAGPVMEFNLTIGQERLNKLYPDLQQDTPGSIHTEDGHLLYSRQEMWLVTEAGEGPRMTLPGWLVCAPDIQSGTIFFCIRTAIRQELRKISISEVCNNLNSGCGSILGILPIERPVKAIYATTHDSVYCAVTDGLLSIGFDTEPLYICRQTPVMNAFSDKERGGIWLLFQRELLFIAEDAVRKKWKTNIFDLDAAYRGFISFDSGKGNLLICLALDCCVYLRELYGKEIKSVEKLQFDTPVTGLFKVGLSDLAVAEESGQVSFFKISPLELTEKKFSGRPLIDVGSPREGKDSSGRAVLLESEPVVSETSRPLFDSPAIYKGAEELHIIDGENDCTLTYDSESGIQILENLPGIEPSLKAVCTCEFYTVYHETTCNLLYIVRNRQGDILQRIDLADQSYLDSWISGEAINYLVYQETSKYKGNLLITRHLHDMYSLDSKKVAKLADYTRITAMCGAGVLNALYADGQLHLLDNKLNTLDAATLVTVCGRLRLYPEKGCCVALGGNTVQLARYGDHGMGLQIGEVLLVHLPEMVYDACMDEQGRIYLSTDSGAIRMDDELRITGFLRIARTGEYLKADLTTGMYESIGIEPSYYVPDAAMPGGFGKPDPLRARAQAIVERGEVEF